MRYMVIKFLDRSYRPRYLLLIDINITSGALFTGYTIARPGLDKSYPPVRPQIKNNVVSSNGDEANEVFDPLKRAKEK